MLFRSIDIDATGDITVTANGGVTASGASNINIDSSAGSIRNSAASDGTADLVTVGGTITLAGNTGIGDSTGSAGLDIDSGGGAVSLTHDGTTNGLYVDYVSADADAVGLTISATSGTGNAIKTARRDKQTGEISHFPLDAFNFIIQINLVGTFRCIAKSAAGMMSVDPLNEDGERGAIVNTASVAGEAPDDSGGGAYGLADRQQRPDRTPWRSDGTDRASQH